MTPRRRRTVLPLVSILALLVLAVLRQRQEGAPSFDPRAAARTRFEEVRGEGVDLARGPCLGLIGPDWVADVVHDPRTSADDDPANQCAEYRSGAARHFVELTPDGRVIRVR